jgi:paraquat-inducible protein B
MSEPDTLPEARSLRGRWPGLVWAIPLAALLVVGYLGVRAMFRRGVDVHVKFGYVEAVTPGDTKVLMRGVEVGHVTRVKTTPDASHVDVTLSLSPRVKSALNSNTHFWLIGEYPKITDVQSIRAAVAGVIIAMAPGEGGTPTRDFTGLDEPPLITPGTRGTYYSLTTATLGSIQPGAAVLYHGLSIGKVVNAQLERVGQFRLRIFVQAPYDAMVRPGAEFWTGSPLKLSLSGSSVTAGLSSPASVLQGSVQFELPEAAHYKPQAPAGTSFVLYDDQSSAQQGPTGPEMTYRVVLNGAAGDMTQGAPVSMLGYTVGRVLAARLAFAPGGRPYTEARIALYPAKLDVVLPEGTALPAWRGATDRAVSRLLAQGYRATLGQTLPLVGPHTVTLAKTPAGAAGLQPTAPLPTIPAAGGGGDDLFAKLNRLPIEQIGENVRQLTGNLARLTGSPELKSSLSHLRSTLAQVDSIAAQVKPEVGPLMKKLNQTAGELQATAGTARAVLTGEGANQDQSLPEAIGQLDQAARSIRELTDYLGRHPEALLRGKAKEKK